MDYKALAQQTAQDILSYSQDTSGWKVVKTSKKITVSSKPSKKFHGNLYRVEGIIPESTCKLSDFLYKPENRITWDKSLKVYNMVQKIDSLKVWIFQHILHLQIISVVTTMPVAIYVHLCKRTQHIPN